MEIDQMKNGRGWVSRMGSGLGSAFRLSDWGMRQTFWAEAAGTAGARVRRRRGGRKARRNGGDQGRQRHAA